ncbi:ferric reductase-like transmembrane domain-containing protein [Noviherbaspirillum agri]
MAAMPTRHRHFLPIPLLVTALTVLPVWWAFPQALPFWRSAGIVSGWAGCGMLLASLLLMIREPRLAEWLGGLERMYQWHHRLGVLAYAMLLLHPLALAADAWDESAALAWSVLAPWRQGMPVWLGWAALGCMMLGLAVALSRRIGYATWHGLHHLLSVAVVLGGLHLLALGLPASLLWTPGLAIAFLLWRLVRADWGLGSQPYIVSRVDKLSDETVEVSLTPLAHPFHARPGQFVLAAFYHSAHFRGCAEYHPFTISAAGHDGRISLGIKALGDCTRNLQSVESGVPVRIQGPFGVFLEELHEGPGLWIAGGIGITPFLAVLRDQALEHPVHPVHLVYLYPTESAAMYLDEIRHIAALQPQLRVQCVATGRGIPDLRTILPDAPQLAGVHCYLCGPAGMVTSARQVLQERGVTPDHVHFERFDFRQ